MQGHIYFIMWISGAGKGLLRKNLEKQNIKNLIFLKSYVTRPMREGEIDGDIYHFISQWTFEQLVEKNEFLEYEFVHNMNYYGTKYADTIKNGIEKWKNVVKEIDILWLKNILTNHPELKKNITSIFLDISESILMKRIAKRWVYMSEEELQNRKESLVMEKVESQKYCNYIIDTSDNNPEKVLKEVLKIIQKK